MMPVSTLKIIWWGVCIVLAIAAANTAYVAPAKFASMTDLLATIFSILIGISLAISAVLASAPKIGNANFTDEGEKERVEKTVKDDDDNLASGLTFVFWSYYISLLLAVLLKWMLANETAPDSNIFLKLVSGGFAGIASYSLLWSATLPDLLHQINVQRKKLS